jgi:hypothetical protein
MSHTDIQREASKIWRLATAPLRRLPDFLIPGAPKCGTSSLFLTAFFGSSCIGLSLDLELSEVIDFFFRNVKEFLWIF